ncbi:MAG: M23 family metallopeptidase [Propionibacteriaceae bacterium]|nr:M23 family metallopeptidase [Propionibacteriaceae bacterium]
MYRTRGAGRLTGHQRGTALTRSARVISRTRGEVHSLAATARATERKVAAAGDLDPDQQTNSAVVSRSKEIALQKVSYKLAGNPPKTSIGRTANRAGVGAVQATGSELKNALRDGGRLDIDDAAVSAARWANRHGTALTVKVGAKTLVFGGKAGIKTSSLVGHATVGAVRYSAIGTIHAARLGATGAAAAGRLTGQVATRGARLTGRAATRGTNTLRKAGAAGWKRGTAAAQRAKAAAVSGARAAAVMVKAAASAIVAAVSGSTVLPVVVGIIAVVALLVAILPGFITGAGHEQHRSETLSAVCISSPYELGPVQPHVEQATVLLGTLHGVEVIGGWRPGNTYDVEGHPAGLAVDLMTDRAKGDAVAAYAQEHAAELGIKYIIWWQKIWSVERAGEGWRQMEDRRSDSANHLDHVHISFNPDPGTGGLETLMAEACGTGADGAPAVNKAAAESIGGWANPTPSTRVTSPYGMRTHPITRVYKLHTGADYGGGCGVPINAAASGTVSSVSPNRAYGNLITIDHGAGIVTRYAHSYKSEIYVRAGDTVVAGQRIAAMGSSGYSTACHLHFEVKVGGGFVDPVAFLQARGLG